MPLHLLGKKSWNVYNSDNLARVKRDEAIAAAYEQEVERRMQEHDAARRAAILRGLPPPPTPSPPPQPNFKTSRDERAIDVVAGGRDRKQRRLAGEDDTDRDIRVARQNQKATEEARDTITERDLKKTKVANDAPLFDQDGHLNLFPVDEKEARRAERNAEAAAEVRKKKQELEEQYTMRFSDAAGKNGLDKKPWYAGEGKSAQYDASATSIDEEPSKNVWGRPDPARKMRDVQRVASADPLAFMKTAQVQLKQAERDRRTWVDRRSREETELKEAAEREKKRKRKRDGLDDDEELEGFSLDSPTTNEKEGEDRRRASHGEHRRHSHHRHNHRHRHRHHRSRSRSPSRTEDKYKDRDRRHKHSHHGSSHRHEGSRERSRYNEHRSSQAERRRERSR